mgnify:CR=1 FL=1
MSRRALLFGSLLGVALAACGTAHDEDAGPMLILELRGAVPVASYDLRVYGADARCDAVLGEPGAWMTARKCEPEEIDQLVRCHLAHVVVKPGATSRIEGITPGNRTVFAVGKGAADETLSRGCAEVVVRDGEAAAVTLTLVDAQ